jgi:hypothetical protein
MPGAGKYGSLTDVFAGGAVVARTEAIERIADAIYVIKELTENATSGLRLR